MTARHHAAAHARKTRSSHVRHKAKALHMKKTKKTRAPRTRFTSTSAKSRVDLRP